MNSLLQGAIDAGLAQLEKEVAVPVEPFGYGTDLSCGTDVDPTQALVDPFSTVGLAQSLVRCWDCPRGSLPNDGKDAADYGLSLREYVNKGTTQRDINALQSRLEAEALKNPRFDRISVSVTPSFSGALVTLRVEAVVVPKGPSGPFQLVLAATSAEIVLNSIAAVTG